MTNSSIKETRQHPRFTVDIAAIVHRPEGVRIPARTRDVSQSGICLISGPGLVAGEVVVIELALAFGENTYSEPLHLNAHLVWCTPIGSDYQVGAKFDGLTEEQTNYLEMFLHFLDGTLAPRGRNDQAEEEAVELTPDEKDDFRG
jgi:hypothetical protein